MQQIFTDWQPYHKDLFGDHTVNLGHSLAESGLFQDDALADLIERTPRQSYHVSTMDPESHDPRSRREGMIDGLSGEQVLQAIRNGHIWLNLRDAADYNRPYGKLLEEIYRELEERTGTKTFKQKMTILISSPNVRVGYHSDVPGQTLWQVRGTKKVYLYPNRAPFLPPADLEKIILGQAHEVSLKFEPWFDDHAQIVDLEPGRMLSWPHNAPHRVVNHDCLNVSVTTEHWTSPLRNAYGVHYANGLLRSWTGAKNLSQSPQSAMAYPKLAVALAHKMAGLQKLRRHRFNIDFAVDPNAPLGFVDITPFELGK
ncbi:MAG: cupin-like domain-containing protein [Caldilineaceae bacterium]|nr:cupin-like domain-containing protein [Caldilineaceae bacterium]